MRRVITISLRALLLLALITLGIRVMSQENKPPAQDAPKYDPSQELTLQGKVQEVKEYHCPISGTVGTHLSVMNADGSGLVEVHVAPATFLKEYDIRIKAGDEVKILGMKAVFDGKNAMLAKTITINQDTYAFRNGKGEPIW